MHKFIAKNIKFATKTSPFAKNFLASSKRAFILPNVFETPQKYTNMMYYPRFCFSTDSDNVNIPPNDNDSPNENSKAKPNTIVLKPFKAVLTEAEEKIKPTTYVLFTASNPIIPFSQQNGVIKTGNLGSSHINHELLYVLQSESNEIYTIGVVLKNDVNKKLKREMSSDEKTGSANNILQGKDDPNSTKATISTKTKNFRVKITEIEFKDNCIFASGIPIKDDKLTKEEKMINFEPEITAIRNIVYSIRYLLQIERIEAFGNLNFDPYIVKDLELEKLDELLYSIVAEIGRVSNLTKESFPEFFQAFLEQTNPITRLFVVKKKLDDIYKVLDIMSKGMKSAEEQIRKTHEMAKARLSIEYIKNNYLGGQQQGQGGQSGMNMSFGMGQGSTNKAKSFMDKLHLIKDDVSKDKIKKEIERFASMDKYSNEYQKIYTYLDEVFSIPWDKKSEDFWDVEYSRNVLEGELFGLEKVKERIIELIAVNKMRRSQEGGQKKGFIICLYGPPGTGKTSIAKAVAKSLKREDRFISFAGVADSHFIKGHRRTYVDSQPGVFVRELIKAKTMNPVFVLDEIDKIGKNFNGSDPYYSLLEILNPEENHNFVDHYLDIKVDFSEVIFILTANETLNMLEPLRNRLEIIDIAPYIEQEKLTIAKKYLIPKVLEATGLLPDSVKFDDQSIINIIKGWCYYESGVRELKRSFEKIARKWALELVNNAKKEIKIDEKDIKVLNDAEKSQIDAENYLKKAEATVIVDAKKVDDSNIITIDIKTNQEPKTSESDKPAKEPVNPFQPAQTIEYNPASIRETKTLLKMRSSNQLVFDSKQEGGKIYQKLQKYLGLPKFDEVYERMNRKAYTGVANVLTVSGFAGHVLSVEIIYDNTHFDKKGHFTITGNLKQVLQESLTIAKSNALRFLPKEKLDEVLTKNFHVHFLQGSTPKDGPSAGITMCTAFLSLILGKPVPHHIAMTGELSLNGDVYKIGGVQSKLTAAKALDITTILIPYGNKADFMELPQGLKDGLTVYFVKTYKEVYDVVFSDDKDAISRVDHYSKVNVNSQDAIEDSKDKSLEDPITAFTKSD